jgi:hypothetical protein
VAVTEFPETSAQAEAWSRVKQDRCFPNLPAATFLACGNPVTVAGIKIGYCHRNTSAPKAGEAGQMFSQPPCRHLPRMRKIGHCHRNPIWACANVQAPQQPKIRAGSTGQRRPSRAQGKGRRQVGFKRREAVEFDLTGVHNRVTALNVQISAEAKP